MKNLTLTLEQKWEQATLANNFLFWKIMTTNPDVCKKMLEIILHIEIDHLEAPNGEQTFDIDYDSKGIRLDVYAKNSTQVFDIEVQTANVDNLPKRARYYTGVMDVDTLKAGDKYTVLKDSYVIFLCTDDFIGQGLPVYTFENLCKENTQISLNDRSFKIFFNAALYDKMNTADEKAFFKFLKTGKSNSDFTENLDRLLYSAKKNLQWRKSYMDFERYKVYAREEGLAEGISQGRELQRQEDEKIIAEITAEKDSQISMHLSENAHLVEENRRLQEEVTRLRQQMK